VPNLQTVGVHEQSRVAIELGRVVGHGLIKYAIALNYAYAPQVMGVVSMTTKHYIESSNESIIATVLRLCDEKFAKKDGCPGYNIARYGKKAFLEKLRSIGDDRKRVFPDIKFSDPYWNIIVCLAIDLEIGRETSIKAACLSSGVPKTTALRCLSYLEDLGILSRIVDPSDGRRVFVRLTDQSKHCLDAWLRNSLRTVGLIDTSEMGLNCMDIGSSSHDF